LEGVDYFLDKNLKIIFQKDSINGFFPTSLEEAFILKNFKNELINNVLIKCIPGIYKEVIKRNGVKNISNKNNLKKYSYELQKKLSNSKSDFSNMILYECLISEKEKIPELPGYLEDGFSWLIEKLLTNSGESANAK